MTFLNTLTNLGNMWPNSFTLWFVDFLTWKVTPRKIQGVFFFTGPPPKKLKYGNLRLGEVR